MNSGATILDAGVWRAADFPVVRSWARPFTPAMLAEIDGAIMHAKRLGLGFERLGKADFPLPLTAPLLAATAKELDAGPGFAVLSGFPVEGYDYDDNRLAFAGLSAHFGRLMPQSHAGAMSMDVKDIGLPYSPENRAYKSNRALPFHSDGAAIVGLFCLETAAEGGLSVLASAGAVHNALLAQRPDLYEVYLKGFRHHRRGEHGPDDPKISPEPIPVFAFQDGLLHCIYDRNQSLWAELEGECLTPRQREAIDVFDATVGRPEMQLHMELRKGDIQFVNNFTILHSRTEYRDPPDRKRHLIRLWLDLPEGRRQGRTMIDLYVRQDGARAAE